MSGPQKPDGDQYQSPGVESSRSNPVTAPGAESFIPTVEDADAKQWGMFAHLGGALLGFLAPLIILIVKKDESPFVAQESKEALNFQLTILIGYVACFVLTAISCGFLAFLLVVPWVVSLVFCILGGLEVNKGNAYRYPFNIRMVT